MCEKLRRRLDDPKIVMICLFRSNRTYKSYTNGYLEYVSYILGKRLLN